MWCEQFFSIILRVRFFWDVKLSRRSVTAHAPQSSPIQPPVNEHHVKILTIHIYPSRHSIRRHSSAFIGGLTSAYCILLRHVRFGDGSTLQKSGPIQPPMNNYRLKTSPVHISRSRHSKEPLSAFIGGLIDALMASSKPRSKIGQNETRRSGAARKSRKEKQGREKKEST